MSNKTDAKLDEGGLNRLLGLLRPPAPSDLLRARVEKAITRAAVSGPVAGSNRAVPGLDGAPRTPLYARFAASLLVIVGVALAIWFPPPPGPGSPGPRHVAAGAVGGDGPRVYAGRPNAADNGGETGFGLALVGGGAPVTGIPLVRAYWPSVSAGTANDPEFGEDNSNELESIPLY